MDKWIKKLFVPVPKLFSVKPVPDDSSPISQGQKGDGSALQQSVNIGSGTSAFKNNKAAFSKLVNVTLAQKEGVSIIKQSGDIDNGAANPQVNPAKEVSPRRRKIKKEKKDSPQEEVQKNGTKRNGISAQRSGNLGMGRVTSGDQEAAGPGEQGEEKENSPAPEQADNIDRPDADVEATLSMSQNDSNSIPTTDKENGDGNSTQSQFLQRDAEACPYCNSKDFVKRGTRKNKLQVVQLYLCKNEECGRTFSAQDVKGKHFPLNIIIEGMSYYNLGFTLEQSCSFLQQKFNIRPGPETLSEWISQYSQLCRYERLRPYAVKMYNPAEVVEVVTMAHRQLFRFRYHRAKTRLMLEEEYRNRRLAPLKEFLDNISSVTPHQYFQEGERMSEIRSKFDKADMIVKTKFNYANRLAAFVLQAVKDNKQRHEQLQRFFIANDSCTVATEVPVYIRREDIIHMENDLRFKITDDGKVEIKGNKKPVEMPKLLTGHIDFIQIRNGQVHLMDYKPDAAKEKPIEQLTWYALAMCRLTGLRLYDFTCSWFDDKDFFQFYPLHVVKKLRGKSRKNRKIFFKDGTWAETSSKKDKLVVVGRDRDDSLETKF